MGNRKQWFAFFFGVSIVANMVSCYPSTWNRGNAAVSFIPQVAARIEKCENPVYLNRTEIDELEKSLSGKVEDAFVDNDLSENVFAYYELTTKGANKNNILFLRMAKDGQRYVHLVYTKTGRLFGAGSGRTGSGGLSRIWSDAVDCN